MTVLARGSLDFAAPGAGAVQAQARCETGPAPSIPDPPVIAEEFFDYTSLVVALRRIRELRGVSYETLDEVGGLPKGMSSKILAPLAREK
jgi:hypothetical protein